MRVDFDAKDTVATAIFRELSKAAVESAQEIVSELNLTGLSPYYQKEFKKIHESGASCSSYGWRRRRRLLVRIWDARQLYLLYTSR